MKSSFKILILYLLTLSLFDLNRCHKCCKCAKEQRRRQILQHCSCSGHHRNATQTHTKENIYSVKSQLVTRLSRYGVPKFQMFELLSPSIIISSCYSTFFLFSFFHPFLHHSITVGPSCKYSISSHLCMVLCVCECVCLWELIQSYRYKLFATLETQTSTL